MIWFNRSLSELAHRRHNALNLPIGVYDNEYRRALTQSKSKDVT
jgi:hypothetical protein